MGQENGSRTETVPGETKTRTEEKEKPAIAQKLRVHGIALKEDLSLMAKNFLACVALPTCGKALSTKATNKIIEFIFYSHPSVEDRIKLAADRVGQNV